MSLQQITANDLQTGSLENYMANQGGAFGFKNRIINGAMVFDQRDSGASVTITNTSSRTYTIDRWSSYGTQASKFSVQQNAGAVTPPTGFTNYLGAVSASAYSVTSGDIFNINQNIEGYNFADLAWGTSSAKPVTLSFVVYSSLTGTFGGAITNSNNTRCYPFSYTISATNTWTTVSVTIPGDTTGTWGTGNGTGIAVSFSLGMGSTYTGSGNAWTGSTILAPTGSVSVVGTSAATFYITGVQLEKGTVATPFEYRDYGRELMMCQRYYTKLDGTNNGLWWQAYSASGQNFAFNITNPVTMRTQPTGAVYGTWTVTNCGQPNLGGQSTTQTSIYVTATSSATTAFYSSSTSGITLSAEL